MTSTDTLVKAYYQLQIGAAETGRAVSYTDVTEALKISYGQAVSLKSQCFKAGLLKPRPDVKKGAIEIVATGQVLKPKSEGNNKYTSDVNQSYRAGAWKLGQIYNDAWRKEWLSELQDIKDDFKRFGWRVDRDERGYWVRGVGGRGPMSVDQLTRMHSDAMRGGA
ncbi:MAG: hypothetical protein AAF562_10075 [Pseudomonadota bacterium]